MSKRSSVPVVLLFMMCIPCASGQLPKRVERCLPYPTIAQEIRDMQLVPPQVRIRVTRVEFDPGDAVPADAREEILTEVEGQVFERNEGTAYLDELANQIAEVPVRGAFQNRGYFKVISTAKLTPLQSEGDISVVASIRVTLGPQYRTGDIRIESADSSLPLAISPEVLRRLIPLQRGELFSVERVRTGIDNLARAYGREGYVDMTAEPDTEIDDPHETIDMMLKINQQVQYRIGSIEFLGVNTRTREDLMRSLPKPGEIFDATRLNEFFKVNTAILPLDASREDVTVRRDPKTRTVAIVFDFRTCSRARTDSTPG